MPTAEQIEEIVDRALAEDLPDITSEAVFTADEQGSARVVSRVPGVLAGLRFARATFSTLGDVSFENHLEDGARLEPGSVIATLEASVRTLLAGERTALNLLQRASGIATLTRAYVDAVEGTGAKIFDTRKTAPGLRALDKAAVVAGGGSNHRYALYDMFLVKNNHIDAAGSIAAVAARIRSSGKSAPLMIEVRSLQELEEAIEAAPDFILLDNMDIETMREAVAMTARRIPLEASGGVNLDTVRAIAETGV
ncbi:MAG: carboxylating nicotinate-nucleotide diphosphorylase, partial [Acidobacteria bacterium]|nr:carboxylating nicotinate-nucleotide diphosphorylase [Acidobacteriota bacterium]